MIRIRLFAANIEVVIPFLLSWINHYTPESYQIIITYIFSHSSSFLIILALAKILFYTFKLLFLIWWEISWYLVWGLVNIFILNLMRTLTNWNRLDKRSLTRIGIHLFLERLFILLIWWKWIEVLLILQFIFIKLFRSHILFRYNRKSIL